MFLTRFIFIFLVIGQTVRPTIHEISDLSQALEYLDDETDLLLDLDNTLITSAHPHHLGSDQWYEGYRRYLQEVVGLDMHEATAIAVAQYIELQSVISVQPVQPDAPQVVAECLPSARCVLGLTVRSAELAEQTVFHLMSTDFCFGEEPLEDFTYATAHGNICRCYGNIIFTSGVHKGLAYIAYLAYKGVPLPRHIVLIDDKERHLRAMEEVCHQWGIEFTGLRYTYMDEAVRSFTFDPELHALSKVVL